MIAVIADDITGAAEIAGIAKSAGLSTLLTMVGEGVAEEDFDVVVYATDTRQMTEAEAVEEVERITRNLPKDAQIFKKTDSVLRGHVLAECYAIMRSSDHKKLLLVPQNPSKGRVVKGGIYYINNVPVNETQFAFDPEFPAKSADVAAFGVPDAVSKDDIKVLLKRRDARTLLAGAADLFSAMIEDSVSDTCGNSDQKAEMLSAKSDKLILVCGSTQSKNVAETPLCHRFDAVECNMPADVFYGKDEVSTGGKNPVKAWENELCAVFEEHGIVLTINYPAQGGKDFAVRLRKTMAEVVKALTDNSGKETDLHKLLLIIEGGATAFEVLRTLGWSSFNVEREHFPGVVEIANSQANIILKPGSYPWGDMLG